MNTLASRWESLAPATRIAIAGLAALALHVFRLGEAPVHLVHDEVVFALNAHAIATTGRGADGALFPLYFHIADNFWSTPVVVYFPALFQLFHGPTPEIVRLPTAIIGAIDVMLLYAVGRRLFARDSVAVAAAAILALTPAHVIHSRLGVDHLYPVPFFLGALLCALQFGAARRYRWLAGSGFLLGAGFYTYMGAVPMMPIYTVLFVVVIGWRSADRVRVAAALIGGFSIAMLPLVPWLIVHPGQFAQQLNMYHLAGSADTGTVRGLLRQFNYPRTVEHVRVYHEFFNPSFLFVSSDASLIDSTRQAGVFVVPIVILLAAGINAVINFDRSRASILILLSFLASPIAAVVVGEVKVNRALVLLPTAALLCGYGLTNMLTWQLQSTRRVIAAILIASALQFGYFYWDYLGPYRSRSGVWFERNRYGAFDEINKVLEAGNGTQLYLPTSPEWLMEHWQLYLAEHGRSEWLLRTHQFVLSGGRIPPDAVGLMPVEGASAADEPGTDHNAVTISEIDGTPSFYVLVPKPDR